MLYRLRVKKCPSLSMARYELNRGRNTMEPLWSWRSLQRSCQLVAIVDYISIWACWWPLVPACPCCYLSNWECLVASPKSSLTLSRPKLLSSYSSLEDLLGKLHPLLDHLNMLKATGILIDFVSCQIVLGGWFVIFNMSFHIGSIEVEIGVFMPEKFFLNDVESTALL